MPPPKKKTKKAEVRNIYWYEGIFRIDLQQVFYLGAMETVFMYLTARFNPMFLREMSTEGR